MSWYVHTFMASVFRPLFEGLENTLEERLIDPLFHQAHLLDGWFLFITGRPFRPVDDSDGNPLAPLLSPFKGLQPIIWVRFGFIIDLVNPAGIPFERVNPVERNAGLEDIDEGKPLMFNSVRDEVGEMCYVARKPTGYEAAVRGNGEEQRVHGRI
jgi:hypothetical protein